jgi:chromosome segregation ATPase
MRGILLGTLAGLAMGILGTWAYTNYLGAGQKLAQAEAELADIKTNLTKATQGTEQLKSETDAMSTQVRQLTAHNDELKKQVNELKAGSENTTAPAPNPMAGIIKAQMANRFEQRLLLLKSRLNLTPEQESAVKAAMAEEAKKMEEITGKMFQGGKVDPQGMAKNVTNDLNKSKSVDQVLEDILTPDQKTAYHQMQDDQKKSSADTMATVEMNQLAPALQLSETQKDQVYAALYQVQMNPPKLTGVADPSNPGGYLEAQAKAKEDALVQILTPAQLATYHQQEQSQLDMRKAMMQKFAPGVSGTIQVISH